MVSLKSPLFKLSLTLTVQLAAIAGFSTLLQAPQPVRAGEISQGWNEYEPEGGMGTPGRREPGGTRGGYCPKTEKPITALVPINNFGATTADYPTLFFYVPQLSSQASSPTLEFVLQDENEQELYKANFKPTTKAGIFSVTIPSNKEIKPLQVGSSYHWYFSQVCNHQDRASDVFVDGWIRRIEPSTEINGKLKEAKKLADKFGLYKDAKIWYDSLATLEELRRNDVKNSAVWQAEWDNLLKAVKLDTLAKESIQGSLPAAE